jgi:hypothetical protein
MNEQWVYILNHVKRMETGCIFSTMSELMDD